ncbi:MAG TPA: adenylate/guanylate cyclase domain-containing protein [Elusimicrobiales bacterium]|nr:adenylate/guanylate cyclase domain-containing protein [Elusimicrobiales bacterium]
MDTSKLSPAQQKRFKNALFLPWIPFFFITVDSVFSEFSLVTISGAAAPLSAVPGYRYIGLSQLVLALLQFAMVMRWYGPIGRFVKTLDPALKPVVRARVSHIYRDMYYFFGISAAARLAIYTGALFFGLSASALFCYLLPAMLVALLAEAGIALANVDATLGWADVLISALYEPEELYAIRPGASIPLSVKMGLLVTVCAILPLLLICFAGLRGARLQDFAANVAVLTVVCVPTLLVGMRFMLESVQRPLDGLVAKMGRIAAGDHDVKSRIYFNDEIARVKSGFNAMVDGLREREAIKETFGRYMSIEIARQLLRDGKVRLGGEEVDAAVMFCDIRNFTPISERMTPAQVVAFLNDYFSYITPPIGARNGVINKFIGDAVMAIFTPRFGSADYAADAVHAALGMRAALAAYNASGKGPGAVRFGIGVQTGKLIAGNIGTTARLEYTFIGDTVNIASRLEGKNKDFGSDILVTRNVLDRIGPAAADELRFESVGYVGLKGKAEPLELFKALS